VEVVVIDPVKSKGNSISRPSLTASHWFALVGWVFIGTSLSGLLFGVLPVRLIDPAWQLRLISAILSSATFLLLGTLLVCCAFLLNERSQRLEQRAELVRRAAGWYAVLLLLLIPCQFYSGFRASAAVQNSENQSIELIKKIIRGVKASDNEAELRGFLASLPTPPEVPARLNAPFPEIRQRLLTNFDSQLNAANYQAGELRRQRLEQFIAEATRNAVQALLMAVAFSGIADKEGPLLGLFQRIGLFRYRY